jgi:hypothetical protein
MLIRVVLSATSRQYLVNPMEPPAGAFQPSLRLTDLAPDLLAAVVSMVVVALCRQALIRKCQSQPQPGRTHTAMLRRCGTFVKEAKSAAPDTVQSMSKGLRPCGARAATHKLKPESNANGKIRRMRVLAFEILT